MTRSTKKKAIGYLAMLLSLFLAIGSAWGATGGSISGVTTDPTGAMIVSATLKLVNAAQHVTYRRSQTGWVSTLSPTSPWGLMISSQPPPDLRRKRKSALRSIPTQN